MAKVLIINKNKFGNCRQGGRGQVSESNKSQLDFVANKKGSVHVGLASAGFLVILFVICTCAFYLFQVNDLAVKGYDVRKLENRISELEKENKQMQIREMELMSMYVIEKSAESFNLVSPTNVTYLEINNTVALR